MKKQMLRLAVFLLTGVLLAFICVSCELPGTATGIQTGSYTDESGRATYLLKENGVATVTIVGYTFSAKYTAKDGEITFMIKTAKGEELQNGTYEKNKISLDAGAGLDAIVLTLSEEKSK